LLEDDLVFHPDPRNAPRFDGDLGEVVVEAEESRSSRRQIAASRRAQPLCRARRRRKDQPLTGVGRKKLREVAGVQIGQTNLLYFRILQQIISARASLQARAKY
jgi:hypothetical protein